MTGLKYSNIRTRVNFIQITVIIVSTVITFLETMKDKFGLTNNISMTIAPILLSTYIGLALAISRFYKLDDHKEELCKLDEAQSFVISGLRHRMRDIEFMKPLYCDQDIDTRKREKDSDEIEEINPDKLKAMLDYFNIIEKNIEDQSKDGLEETIANCKQKFDLVMNLSERVYYKNILLKIRIDKTIVDGNKKVIHHPNNKNKLRKFEYKIKKERCFLWKYICCFCNDCMYHYIDKNIALDIIDNYDDHNKDIEKGEKEEEKSHVGKPLADVVKDMSYVDMGYDTPNEDNEPLVENWLDPKYGEQKFGIKGMKALSKLSDRKQMNMFKSHEPKSKVDNKKIYNSKLRLSDEEIANCGEIETNDDESNSNTNVSLDISKCDRIKREGESTL